jgi:ribosome biogenesis GTPase
MTTSESSPGLVVASYGRRGILEDQSGLRRRFVLKGRKLRAVCGDHVLWQTAGSSEDCLVTAITDRENVLKRPDSRGRPEFLAANLSQLVVVLAPLPEPDFYLADRYLCAAELMHARALVVWNKIDTATAFPAELIVYEQIGYPIVQASATTGAGIEELRNSMSANVNILVGQSGVGKSSLINRLIPATGVTVGELSAANKEGRHTTTASFMHELPDGGKLIDSPGVREFAPVIDEAEKIQIGFREIVELANECRFANCQHLREPNCAVKLAVEEKRISVRRYESYKRLHNTTAALK